MTKYTFYIIIAAISLSACSSDKKEQAQVLTTEIISEMEKTYNAATVKDTESTNNLLTKYAEYASANPQDKINNARYLRRSAQIYAKSKAYEKAAGATVLALRQFYGTMDTEANIASLVGYYRNLQNSEAAETTMNGYLMAFPDGVKVEEYKTALGDKYQSLTQTLETIALEIVETPEGGQPGLNSAAVNKFIGVSEIYALTNHTRDTLASDYLFKAGKLAMTVGNHEKANELYQWIYEILKTKESASALFTHAFTLDSQLGRKDEAKVLYERFLAEFPDHHFADDSEFQLKNLGKDDAQIIKEFNEKAKPTK